MFLCCSYLHISDYLAYGQHYTFMTDSKGVFDTRDVSKSEYILIDQSNSGYTINGR